MQQPTVQETYEFYDNDQLVDFVSAAEALLETDIDRYHRIRLLALLGTAVVEPSHTTDSYTEADQEWRIANCWHDGDDPRVNEALKDLRNLLDYVLEIVLAEAEMSSDGMEDDSEDDMEDPPAQSTPSTHGAYYPHEYGPDGIAESSGTKGKATDVEDAAEERREMSTMDNNKGV